MFTRPVWAEISRQRLVTNYEKLRLAASPHAELLPTVKANAYGHDVMLCAPVLMEAGAKWVGVTGTEEALQVRTVCPSGRILLMSGIWAGEADAALDHNLTPVVWEPYHLDLLEEAANRRGIPPGGFPVHLEIDTGMSRQGVHVSGETDGLAELKMFLKRFHERSRLRIEGVMTHFSSPGTLSSTRENPQLSPFSAAVDLVLSTGHSPEWLHAGNSATVLAGPDREKLIALASKAGARLMMRPGLSLYGYLDRFTCDGEPFTPLLDGQRFEPVLTLKTRVTSLRTIQAGETVGYDRTFIARRETRLALLPAGYADGINRLLSGRGHVLIRGQRAPITGRVSMDQTIADVTDLPGVCVGDEVVLIGSMGKHSISAWEIADLTGTIVWEVLCAISARVPRVAVN
jgi:alanine racemase